MIKHSTYSGLRICTIQLNRQEDRMIESIIEAIAGLSLILISLTLYNMHQRLDRLEKRP